MIGTFQRKPVIVEALQWTGANDREMNDFTFGLRRSGNEVHVHCGPYTTWTVIYPQWWAVRIAPKRIILISDQEFADIYEPADLSGEGR